MTRRWTPGANSWRRSNPSTRDGRSCAAQLRRATASLEVVAQQQRRRYRRRLDGTVARADLAAFDRAPAIQLAAFRPAGVREAELHRVEHVAAGHELRFFRKREI